jgi:acetyl-CoA carboxylase carboxyl transferase subunit alpha
MQAGFGRFNGQSRSPSWARRRARHDRNPAQAQFRHGAARGLPQGGAHHGHGRALRHPGGRFVDTAGAYPGIGAEERGQAEAIARSTERSLELGVPNLAIIIGEGGSGGAIAIATANRVLMLENAIYSGDLARGLASILWRDAARRRMPPTT